MLNISVFLDNSCTCSVMSKIVNIKHETLHKCHKIPSPGYTVMHAGNDDITVHIWIVITLTVQQVAMQLQLQGFGT